MDTDMIHHGIAGVDGTATGETETDTMDILATVAIIGTGATTEMFLRTKIGGTN